MGGRDEALWRKTGELKCPERILAGGKERPESQSSLVVLSLYLMLFSPKSQKRAFLWKPTYISQSYSRSCCDTHHHRWSALSPKDPQDPTSVHRHTGQPQEYDITAAVFLPLNFVRRLFLTSEQIPSWMPTLGLPLDSYFCLGPPLRFNCWRSSIVLGCLKPLCFTTSFPYILNMPKHFPLFRFSHQVHRDLLFQKLLPFGEITVTTS